MFYLFFFNATAPPDISTLSLRAPLQISERVDHHDEARARLDGDVEVRGRDDPAVHELAVLDAVRLVDHRQGGRGDRKSTRLNSSHANISYAVFCLKKKTHELQRHSQEEK